MSGLVRGIWRNADFGRFWLGVSASFFGSQVVLVVIPLIAAVTLNATPGQMGLLLAAGRAPFLVLSLPAGVWIDRLHRQPILVGANFGRGLLLALIPLTAAFGVLQFELLCAIVLLSGTCDVMSEIARSSFLPTLLSPEELTDGNSKLSLSQSVTNGAGPSIAGALMQFFGPLAIGLSAVSFLISAAFLALMRPNEPPARRPSERQSLWSELVNGVRIIFEDPMLRPLNLCASTFQLFFGALMAVYALYVTKDLGIEPSRFGLILAAAAPGSFLGALVARRTSRRFGWGRTMVGSALVITSSPMLIPLAGGTEASAFLLLALAQFLMWLGIAHYSIHYFSLCQTVVPARLLGRVSATAQFISSGMAPIGSLLGGALGELLGVPLTVVIAAVGTLLAMGWLVFSSVGQHVKQPEFTPA